MEVFSRVLCSNLRNPRKFIFFSKQGFYATFYPERYALLQTWVSESEVKLGDYTRAIMLSSKSIERHSTLNTTVTLEKSLFRSRQTIFEHLVDYFENSNGDEEVEIIHSKKYGYVVQYLYLFSGSNCLGSGRCSYQGVAMG